MCAVDEGLAEIELASFHEVVREALQNLLQGSCLDPTLEAAKACGVWRVPIRHISPWGSGAQDPQHAIEHVSRVPPRTPTSVVSNRKRRKKRFYDGPLLIGQVHLDLRSQTELYVDPLSDCDLISTASGSDVYEMRSSSRREPALSYA